MNFNVCFFGICNLSAIISISSFTYTLHDDTTAFLQIWQCAVKAYAYWTTHNHTTQHKSTLDNTHIHMYTCTKYSTQIYTLPHMSTIDHKCPHLNTHVYTLQHMSTINHTCLYLTYSCLYTTKHVHNTKQNTKLVNTR